MCGRYTQFAEPKELEKAYHKKVEYKYPYPRRTHRARARVSANGYEQSTTWPGRL